MKARAVLISDVHFNVKNLVLASASMRAAFLEARRQEVPLIIAGDLNDCKAIVRGECINALLSLFNEFSDVNTFVLVGNHDLINEKGKAHTLNFLRPYATLIDEWTYVKKLDLYMIPYQTDTDELRAILKQIPEGSTVIMHQGIMGAAMGEYIVDKSSIDPSELANFRVITGHYHRAQDIKTGRPRKGGVGLASYIGTPYTVTFTEATDGPKGIQILGSNGLLTQVPLDLRKHVVIETRYDRLGPMPGLDPKDLLWLKVSGPASELDKLKKKQIGQMLLGHENFKLDRIYDEAEKAELQNLQLPPDQLFDKLIDASEETAAQKAFLKQLWRLQCA
jgi:DNA repair exonuclease SbcCD nuclease subunit